MAIQNTRHDDDSAVSFGVRELRQAKAAQRPRPTNRPPAALEPHEPVPVKSGRENYGTDPYNTSGSFDRSMNWARVGKR
jgi:hypothetical protein